jgi:diguanylate cyclase (GGDEF)-like protein/PAS domain S-box-containing protein
MINSSAILGSKILIVDDQPANVQLLEMMLEKAGYHRLTSTMDPASVCALHGQNKYDLILLDLHMPHKSGLEVLAELNQIEPDGYLPVLVITAQPSQKLPALQAGAKDFISKPFDRAEILTRIHNLLEVRLLHEQAKAHGKQMEDEVQARTAELRQTEELFRQLATNIPEALWIRDVEKKTIQYVNSAWETLCGMTAAPGDAVDKIYQAIHPDDLKWVTHERRKTPNAHVSSEYRLVRPDRSVRWVSARTFPIANPSGTTPLIVEIIEDVTQRREAQQQLVHLARHDTLTGLPNRAFLYEALAEALALAKRENLVASVLLIDIDHFKNVNDTLGHTVGDALLCEFAAILAKCIRPGDTAARLGGDEFAVILLTPTNDHGASDVAMRIGKTLRNPLALKGQDVMATASIGIASYPGDAQDIETLIRYADAAMYESKTAGRDTYRCYSPEMNARATAKSDIESALKLAQIRDEFVLHYQPKMNIDSGKWTSVEALIRWSRPGHGLVAPNIFVPALEEMGLIVAVGGWVIEEACRQIQEWQNAGLGQVPIAVNVSSRQVREERFTRQVAETIAKYRIDPKLLEFEITESTLMAHGEATDAALRELKNLGISISIDDFGTGYSNLAYLKRFLVDTLKIDIAFIRDVTTNADDATIAVAIINMAHSLRLKVVAEGVETREQLDFLRAHGCDEVQGYILSVPLPAEEFAARFLRNPAPGVELFSAASAARLRLSHA